MCLLKTPHNKRLAIGVFACTNNFTLLVMSIPIHKTDHIINSIAIAGAENTGH